MPNHHAVGTYLTTLHKVKDELGAPYQSAWDTLESFRVGTRVRDDFAADEYRSVLPSRNDAAHVMSYAAVDNLHMFYNVSEDAAVKHPDKDMADAEFQYAVDKIEILDPDVLVLQGTGDGGPAYKDTLKPLCAHINDRINVETIQTTQHPRALANHQVTATELVDRLEDQ